MLNVFNVLTLLFIGLKLTSTIAWNWFLVLSPTILLLVIYLLLVVLAAFVQTKTTRRF